MNESVPDTHLDLLQGPIYVQLASYMKSGAIQVNPVWCSYDGSQCLGEFSEGARKRQEYAGKSERDRVSGRPRTIPSAGLKCAVWWTRSPRKAPTSTSMTSPSCISIKDPYPFRQDGGDTRDLQDLAPARAGNRHVIRRVP